MSRSQVYAHAKNRFLTCLRARQACTHNIQVLALHTLLRSTTSECGLLCTVFVNPISSTQALMTAQVGVQYPCIPILISSPLYCFLFLFPPLRPSFSLPSSLSSSLVPYSTVKFWCVNRPHSIFSMGTKASVWCLQFRPAHQYHMAYGSAGIHSLTLVKKSTT